MMPAAVLMPAVVLSLLQQGWPHCGCACGDVGAWEGGGYMVVLDTGEDRRLTL